MIIIRNSACYVQDISDINNIRDLCKRLAGSQPGMLFDFGGRTLPLRNVTHGVNSTGPLRNATVHLTTDFDRFCVALLPSGGATVANATLEIGDRGGLVLQSTACIAFTDVIFQGVFFSPFCWCHSQRIARDQYAH